MGLNFFRHSLLILSFSLEIFGQTILLVCTDPAIIAGRAGGPTFCDAACADLTGGTTSFSTCNAAGDCVCNVQCYLGLSPPPTNVINQGHCTVEPIAGPNYSPTRKMQCNSRCGATCPGGSGTLCQEDVSRIPAPDIYGRVCTCVCPPTTRCNLFEKIVRIKNSPLGRLKKIFKLLILKAYKIITIFYGLSYFLYFLFLLGLAIGWYLTLLLYYAFALDPDFVLENLVALLNEINDYFNSIN